MLALRQKLRDAQNKRSWHTSKHGKYICFVEQTEGRKRELEGGGEERTTLRKRECVYKESDGMGLVPLS